MRRLPIYFLVDVSESMVGEPIKQVEKDIKEIICRMRTNPYALETVFISMITFVDKVLVNEQLIPLYEFVMPSTLEVSTDKKFSFMEAVRYLKKDIDVNVVKTTAETKGDWKPIIILFVNENSEFDDIKYARNELSRFTVYFKKVGDNFFTDTRTYFSIEQLLCNSFYWGPPPCNPNSNKLAKTQELPPPPEDNIVII